MSKHRKPVPASKNNQATRPKDLKQEEPKERWYMARPVNRNYLLSGIAINIILFTVFKYCYPLPDFCTDADGYVHAAAADIKAFYRPFGYSRFLQIVHGLMDHHYFIVAVQYFLSVAASICCFFTIDYLYTFQNKRVRFLSWLLLNVNPCLLVLANTFMSDILFVSLSVLWFCSCLFILKKKKWWALIVQLALLYYCFSVRYNAMYYPVITLVVFLMVRGVILPYRVVGILGSFFLIYASYNGIKHQNQKITGTEVFSGFGGWQMANNALSIYKEIDPRSLQFDDPQLILLDKFVKKFIDSIPAADQAAIREHKPTSTFIWSNGSPLRQFLFYQKGRYRASYYYMWYSLAPLYQEYGTRIIKEHPFVYARRYMLPNLGLYFIPDLEIMKQYRAEKQVQDLLSEKEINTEVREWLNIGKGKIILRQRGLQEKIMSAYPVVHGICTLFFLVIPAAYFIRCRKRKEVPRQDRIVLVLFWYLFICADIVFNTATSTVTFRYVIAVFITGFSLPLYFMDQLLVRMDMAGKTDQVEGTNRSHSRLNITHSKVRPELTA